jgi:hypothetical protein
MQNRARDNGAAVQRVSDCDDWSGRVGVWLAPQPRNIALEARLVR